MQVTPALPWTDETEGGVIRLAEPITYSQLVSGYLDFILEDNGVLIQAVCNEGSLGFVIKEPTNLGIVYYIQEFSGSLSELTVVKETSAPAGVWINSVQISETYATPAFPWQANSGGTIHLNSPVSCQDILDGKIIFVTKSFNSYIKTDPYEVGDEIHLVTSVSSDYYSIDKYDGTSSELTLSQVTQMNTQLWDVVFPQEAQIPILIAGLPFNATQNGMARILVINEDVTAQEMSENYLDIVITDENQSEDKHATCVRQESWVNVKYGDVIAFRLEKVTPYAWRLSRSNSDTAFIVKSIAYNQ